MIVAGAAIVVTGERPEKPTTHPETACHSRGRGWASAAISSLQMALDDRQTPSRGSSAADSPAIGLR